MTPGQQAHSPDSGTPRLELANSPADHAVVIGSSIAGLMAARVLSEHFACVTVVERDWLPDGPAYRKGVPQARHAHTLLPQGQMILEQLFPGLVDELLAGGAIAIDAARDIAFFEAGAWHTPRARDVKMSIACSRPVAPARCSAPPKLTCWRIPKRRITTAADMPPTTTNICFTSVQATACTPPIVV